MRFIDLDYNSETGVFRWKVGKGRVGANDEAGYTLNHHSGKNYKMIQYNGQVFYAHRVAFEMHYGFEPYEVDHVNGNSMDNRICNLREVKKGENQRNTKARVDSKTGISGVTKFRGKYKVMVGGRYFGLFSDFFEACCKRKSVQIKNGYHVNHGI